MQLDLAEVEFARGALRRHRHGVRWRAERTVSSIRSNSLGFRSSRSGSVSVQFGEIKPNPIQGSKSELNGSGRCRYPKIQVIPNTVRTRIRLNIKIPEPVRNLIRAGQINQGACVARPFWHQDSHLLMVIPWTVLDGTP